jgi:hypothetical protein
MLSQFESDQRNNPGNLAHYYSIHNGQDKEWKSPSDPEAEKLHRDCFSSNSKFEDSFSAKQPDVSHLVRSINADFISAPRPQASQKSEPGIPT